MQALRRRYQNAQRQVARRNTKHNARRAADMFRQDQVKERLRNDVLRHNVAVDRKERWEAWFLGPLKTGGEDGAGKRGEGAAGLLKRKTLTPELRYSRYQKAVLKRQGLEDEKARERGLRVASGGPRAKRRMERVPQDYIVKGDRVVVKAQSGPAARYRGEIRTVLAVDRQKKICSIEGMTIRQVRARKEAPSYTIFCDPNWDPERQVPLPISFLHLRPVKTIINSDGQKEDVILGTLSENDLASMGTELHLSESQDTQEQVSSEMILSKDEVESEDQRLAREQASMNLTPEQVKERFPSQGAASKSEATSRSPNPPNRSARRRRDEEDPTTPSDTLRLQVDTQTWIPTLLRAPLPGTVIDELRGKYSVFRTRHEPEYIKRLQRFDSAKKRYQDLVKTGGQVMDTPRREAALRAEAQRRDQMRRQGRVLDDEILKGIGRLMWDRGLRLDAEQKFAAAQRWKEKYGGVPKNIPMTHGGEGQLESITGNEERQAPTL